MSVVAAAELTKSMSLSAVALRASRVCGVDRSDPKTKSPSSKVGPLMSLKICR